MWLVLLESMLVLINILQKRRNFAFASNLIRVTRLAAVLAGALLLIAGLWNLLLEIIVGGSESFSEFVVTTSWTVLSTMYLLGSLLLLVALVGLYARQSESAGALGLVGFLAALVGTGLLVGSLWTQAFVVASSAIEALRSST